MTQPREVARSCGHRGVNEKTNITRLNGVGGWGCDLTLDGPSLPEQN